jgi:hypothetical protein
LTQKILQDDLKMIVTVTPQGIIGFGLAIEKGDIRFPTGTDGSMNLNRSFTDTLKMLADAGL